MARPDKRPQFVSSRKARENKVKYLQSLNTPEARKELKGMNVQWHGKPTSTNTKGFYGRVHPVKIKVTAKTRSTLSAAKQIMSGRY